MRESFVLSHHDLRFTIYELLLLPFSLLAHELKSAVRETDSKDCALISRLRRRGWLFIHRGRLRRRDSARTACHLAVSEHGITLRDFAHVLLRLVIRRDASAIL